MKREIVRITGVVQGVGFRYHVARIARRFSVVGNVRNLRRTASVEIDVEGEARAVDGFIATVLADPPSAARIEAVARQSAEPCHPASFEIAMTSDD